MTMKDVCTKLHQKKAESADAGRMAFVRLLETLQKYGGDWAAFVPKTLRRKL